MKEINKNHRVIFTNLVDTDDYKEAFEEWCEDNNLDPEEEDLYRFIDYELDTWLADEKENLNIPCGDIIAIADLGLWDGRHSAYKILKGGKVKEIFHINTEDYCDFYCDRYDVRATLTHHDGTNHLLFREVREGREKAFEKLCNALYNQEEVTRKQINYCTKSLRKPIAALYGW